jgi:ribosomal protein S18 acetylase RimI-like enzyme
LKIRPAAVSDAGEIVRIHIRCWRENFLGLIDEAALQSIDESAWRNRQEERLASGTRKCLVAHTDHKILGFGECGPVRDSTYGPVGEILSLFVSPGEQGSGVGRLLFSALAAELQHDGFPQLIVKTMRDSPQSRAFYERVGCVLNGESTFEFAGRRYPEAVYCLKMPRTMG